MFLATFQVLPAAIDYTRAVSIAGWSFHINTLEIGNISPIVATHCWPVSCQQTFNRNGRAQLVELSLFYKLYPVIAGLSAGVKYQRQSNYMHYFNCTKTITFVTSTYKTDQLSSLLTIFTRLQKEQYRRIFCYTTANFRAPVCQQWLLISCTVVLKTHCWKRWFPPLQGDMITEELYFTGDISGLTSCY